jgi:integrase
MCQTEKWSVAMGIPLAREGFVGKPARTIGPAAVRAGIERTIGWHTFPHTYSTMLIANGENVKVVQELMRHAHSRSDFGRLHPGETRSQKARSFLDRIPAKFIFCPKSCLRGNPVNC